MTEKEFLKRFREHLKIFIPIMGKELIISNLKSITKDLDCPFYNGEKYLLIKFDGSISNFGSSSLDDINKKYSESTHAWGDKPDQFNKSKSLRQKMIAIVKAVRVK